MLEKASVLDHEWRVLCTSHETQMAWALGYLSAGWADIVLRNPGHWETGRPLRINSEGSDL
jgi:hypothetical protein